MIRVHAFIEGRVQGVSYRFWTLRQAQDLRLTGWVRNLKDGRVELVAEGEENKVNQLITLIKKGPMLANVKHLDVIKEEATGEFKNFEIMA